MKKQVERAEKPLKLAINEVMKMANSNSQRTLDTILCTYVFIGFGNWQSKRKMPEIRPGLHDDDDPF